MDERLRARLLVVDTQTSGSFMRAKVSRGPPRHAAQDGLAGGTHPAAAKISAAVFPSQPGTGSPYTSAHTCPGALEPFSQWPRKQLGCICTLGYASVLAYQKWSAHDDARGYTEACKPRLRTLEVEHTIWRHIRCASKMCIASQQAAF